MTLLRTSLRSFLPAAKTSMKTAMQQQAPITFVVGNESADLDSLCSTLLYAYIHTHTPPYTLHVPLSNLPREDLALRPELKPVLSGSHLQPDDLITLSDLPRKSISVDHSSLIRANNARFILVDHNALTGPLAHLYGDQVVGCVDHHDDEKAVPAVCNPEPRIITKCGSCASLVVNYGRKSWEAWSGDNESPEESRHWDAELAQLALAPILIDTNNLRDEHKVTDADVQALKFLETRTPTSFSRDDYFNEISEAKQNIGGLSLENILRKDYKMWEENGMKFGASSIVKDIDFLIEKSGGEEELMQGLRDFANGRGLSVFAAMTTSNPDGVFTRELLVFGFGGRAIRVCKEFEERSAGILGLKSWHDGKIDVIVEGKEWSRCWIQERVENSRKQIGPLLRKAMNATT